MKVFDVSDIRNVGVIGHGAAGKTSLASALLFDSGAVSRLGKVEQGNTVTDYDDEEIHRKVSISPSLAFFEWNKKKINLIDTPGYGTFIAGSKAALRVADAAVAVVCGVAGVEVQTEKAWSFAEEFGLPRLLFINKLDRERSSHARALESIQSRFGRTAVPVQLPIGSEKDFRGVVDLLEMKAILWAKDESGKFETADVPADLSEEAAATREKLLEMVAETDEKLMERFFEAGDLPEAELRAGLAAAVKSGKIYPVLCGSALFNIGAQKLMDAMVELLPSPAERGEAAGVDPKNQQEARRRPVPEEPYSAFVFKTIADPFSGRISLFRVYSGVLRSDSAVHNVTRNASERFGSISLMQGKELIHVPEVKAGDIAAIPKLKETHTGDTLADKAHPIAFPAVSFPEPSISFAIEPKSRGDEEKISNALQRLSDEDPTIKVSRDPRTHEMLISGTGELHVEVAVAKMKKKFGVEAILHPPKVPYLETIKAKSEGHGRHKKQTGGHGQFADCKIRMEPLARGSGFEFVDEIFGGSIPQNFRPAVEKGIQESRLRGYLAGFTVVDFRVILHDGAYHTVDSSEMAFKIAGHLAFKAAMEHARPTLLEPIMTVSVETPEELMGDIMGDLNSRRGRVQGMDTQGHTQIIKAQVPMAEMLAYSNTLKSITGGRGSYHMELSHYEEVPSQLQTKIIAEHKPHKTEDEEGA
ncbi:MAG TPA: elongation factor G [Candidatus Polarisedimenticolia bacterium]|nr:elongation factor G [Candidatus Polarisedimenticolia bacterium]